MIDAIEAAQVAANKAWSEFSLAEKKKNDACWVLDDLRQKLYGEMFENNIYAIAKSGKLYTANRSYRTLEISDVEIL